MWKDKPGNGQYLEGQDFTISYITGGLLSEHKDETALIDERDGGRTYYILNGDWRKEYERLVSHGYDACKALYDSQKAKHRSRWSEDDDTDVTNEEAAIILNEYLKARSA
jgi:hypothetical protein